MSLSFDSYIQSKDICTFDSEFEDNDTFKGIKFVLFIRFI